MDMRKTPSFDHTECQAVSFYLLSFMQWVSGVLLSKAMTSTIDGVTSCKWAQTTTTCRSWAAYLSMRRSSSANQTLACNKGDRKFPMQNGFVVLWSIWIDVAFSTVLTAVSHCSGNLPLVLRHCMTMRLSLQAPIYLEQVGSFFPTLTKGFPHFLTSHSSLLLSWHSTFQSSPPEMVESSLSLRGWTSYKSDCCDWWQGNHRHHAMQLFLHNLLPAYESRWNFMRFISILG